MGVAGAEAGVAGGEDISRKMAAAVTVVVAVTEGEEVIFRHFSMVDPSCGCSPPQVLGSEELSRQEHSVADLGKAQCDLIAYV